jgi:hypothetical protein
VIELHREKRNAAVFLDRVDRDDVRMVDGSDRLCLALEALTPLGVRGRQLGKELQRHLAMQPGVFGDEDLSHAALPERADDDIVIECSGIDTAVKLYDVNSQLPPSNSQCRGYWPETLGLGVGGSEST